MNEFSLVDENLPLEEVDLKLEKIYPKVSTKNIDFSENYEESEEYDMSEDRDYMSKQLNSSADEPEKEETIEHQESSDLEDNNNYRKPMKLFNIFDMPQLISPHKGFSAKDRDKKPKLEDELKMQLKNQQMGRKSGTMRKISVQFKSSILIKR